MIKTFEVLNSVFSKLVSKKIELPADFDFHLFSKVISVTLEKTDHSVVIVKVLIFIYNNILVVPKYVVARLAMMLMQKKFIDLFCHWSHIVRYVFHHLVWFRLFHLFSELEVEVFDIL